MRRLQVERESLESKMEAEKHVMRAQLRDLMEKQQAEVRRLSEEHGALLEQSQQDLRAQLEGLRRAAGQLAPGRGPPDTEPPPSPRLAELEAQAKQKTEEASKSEAKFLKTKAWSKSRIRQLEEELRKSQGGGAPPELTALRQRITELEEEKEESLWRLEQYDQLRAHNGVLEQKLVVYEEQQRSLQADLEQVTQRATSQASESGSADEPQSTVLEWQEMVSEAVSSRDHARGEKASMALRISHLEEEREALVSRQQELEEELTRARGQGTHRAPRRGGPAPRSLQEDFEFDGQAPFQEPGVAPGSTEAMEGENMGGGLRSVVAELELERNQLQEQILGLEEHCQDLEDRLQLQARIETLQNESERLQGQLANLRSQQSRDAEKHQLLVTSLNQQLKGLSDTQECLESSLIEKENTLALTSEKLELINSLRENLREKEIDLKDVSDKLLYAEHNLMEITQKSSGFEKQSLGLKAEVADLSQKLSLLKDKTQKQEAAIETFQTELEQTNEELDKLNTSHLEERAQLIQDLQGCEREIDNLKDILIDKEKELSALSGSMLDYNDQISALEKEVRVKEEDLARTEKALSEAQCHAHILRDSQDSDQQTLNLNITELVEKLKGTETELIKAKEDGELKAAEVEELTKQGAEYRKNIQVLKDDLQEQVVSHNGHIAGCETHISSLKEQVALSACTLQKDSEGILIQLKEKDLCNDKLKQELLDKDQVFDQELKSLKEERNNLSADVAKHNIDMQKLSERLKEHLERQEQLEKVTQEKVETITILGDQLKNNQEQAEVEKHKFITELQARESENIKLGKELESKSENISKLKNLLKNAKAEKQQLQGKLKELNKDLDSQKKNVEELSEKLKSALQLNSNLEDQFNHLKDENERLETQVTVTSKNVSELERDLHMKVIDFENQNSEKSKMIQVLQRDEEGLRVQTQELNRVLERSSQSISEKSNKCDHLNQLLSTKEKEVTLLKENIKSVSSHVEELQNGIKEREQTLADLRVVITTNQNQHSELTETLSLLQEQHLSLKSDLIEREVSLTQKEEECTMLQNDIVQKTSVISDDQAEFEALRVQCSNLQQQIEGKDDVLKNVTQECKNYKENLVSRDKKVTSLTNKLSAIEVNVTKLESEKAEAKTSLDNFDAKNIGLRKELELKQVEMSGFHGHIQALTEQNHQLRAACEIREKELAQQIQVAYELDGRLKGLLEQNSNLSVEVVNLSEESKQLKEDLAQKIQSFAEVVSERNLLQEKVLGLEMQHSEKRKIIEGLLKKIDDLTLETVELNNVLEQNKRTHAESLLLKSAECKNLSDTLRAKEDEAEALQEQLDRLTTQLNQLNLSMTEKETIFSEQCANMEAQNNQMMQLHETLSLLQEQGSALKSGLMEKDTMHQQKVVECSAFQKESMLQKDTVSKMQGEAASLREECLDLHRQMEEKEQFLRNVSHDLRNHKDELNMQNELVASLTNQLGVMTEISGKTDIEINNLRSAVETVSTENQQLVDQVNHRKTELEHFRNNIQALNEKYAVLNSEHQKTLVEQSKLLENVSNLKETVSDMENQVSNLTEELKMACSISESLGLTVQEKEDSLKQQGYFLQQLQAKSVETEGQTSQKSLVITQLQTQIQNLQQCLENKEAMLQQNEKDLCLTKTELTGEKTKLQNDIDLNVETIARIKRELSDAVGKNTELGSQLANQEIQMKIMVDKNCNLGSQVTQFDDLILILRNQIDILNSESSVLKATVKEKEIVMLEFQKTSLAASENLNSKFVAKETECGSLKEQLSHIQESLAKLNDSLQAHMSEIQSLKETIKEKESLLLVHTKSLEEMQTKAEETTLIRAQFMQSTELISQLQSQVQLFSTESAHFSKSEEEKQSAFSSLQDKYAELSEEIQIARNLLTIRTGEVTNLSKSLDDSNSSLQAAEDSVDILRKELLSTKEELRETLELNSSLSKQNEEAVSRYKTNTSLLTMEMESLKSKHVQVEVQKNLLTEKLEQRKMDLHAINSQYTGQAKQMTNLVSELQRLEEQNKSLHEGIGSLREEHQINLTSINNENISLKEEINTFVAEKETLEQRHVEHTRSTQEELQQLTSHMNETVEKAKSEKEKLQDEVSVKAQEIFELKSSIHKIEQILQDSEKEWLLVLDKESKDKNYLLEQLKSVESEIHSKNVKVSSLKQELDNLQAKLSDAASAIQMGSEQLKAKELEASASRLQLENILASVQEKEIENNHLQQILQDAQAEMEKLKKSKVDADNDLSVLSQSMSERSAASSEEGLSLKVRLKEQQERNLLELESLKGQLDGALVQLQKAQYKLEEGEMSHKAAYEQINDLQVEVNQLQAQCHSACEKEKEAIAKQSSLCHELQAKAEQTECMSIQISQQKELLAGLSQQLKEKDLAIDLAIAQVIESASNERIKLADENGSLQKQLQSMEQEYRSLLKKQEDKLQHLEEHILLSKKDIESKISENSELNKEKDNFKAENIKLSKDKDAIKKKLQAALLLRKDLMKRLEQFQKQKEENGNTEELSLLQQRLQEMKSQEQVSTRQYEENILLLENKILDKENEISLLERGKDIIVGSFQTDRQTLEAALNDKEHCLSETLLRLNEKTSLLTELQTSISEKELASQEGRHDLQQKIQYLEYEVSRREDILKQKSESFFVLENELAQMKQEKAVLQKKAQAALIARKETLKKSQEKENKLVQELSQLKDEFKALLEQHAQQTNDLDDLQLKFEHQSIELENISPISLSRLQELEILKQLVKERDTTLRDLKINLAENNTGHSLSTLHSELDTLRSDLEAMSSEVRSKNESLLVFEHSSQELLLKLELVEKDLEEAHMKIKGQTEELDKYQQALQVEKSGGQQEKHKLIDEHQAFESQVVVSRAAAEETQRCSDAITNEHRILLEEKKGFLEQIRQLKANLQTAVESVSQKSLEIQHIQSELAETHLKLNEEKYVLAKELEKAQLYRMEGESSKMNTGLLQQEKENAFRFVDTLQNEVALFKGKLSEAEEPNDQCNQNIPIQQEDSLQQDVLCKEEVQSLDTLPEHLEAKLKERDKALFMFQSLVTVKEELIASLEHQLQRQIHLHELAMEKMRTQVDQLQKSEQVFSKDVDQENISKTALLTRKLQAALVSRKDLMRQNSTLKNQLETMKVNYEDEVGKTLSLESIVGNLKQQNIDIENVISSQGTEKDRLIAEVDRILNDNHNLSAACESLKRTIENITQQKQAFSCQLESLKDSQTEELSEWKSKHSELKQDYESLFQSYENVCSEMDKMRLLLEGGSRERQEALVQLHQLESEREVLEMQARDVGEENVRIKEKMRKFAKAKQNTIDVLEKENQNIRKQLLEFDQKRQFNIDLTVKIQQLEERIRSLQESAKIREEELTEVQSEKIKMSEELKEAISSLEKFQFESKSFENMQFKLDEALGLNNSLAVQIQTHNAEFGAQQQMNDLLQKEKQSLLAKISHIENDHELHLGDKDNRIKDLQDIRNDHSQEMICLHEKVRILEDDKSLLQEELENVQEISEKVKNENENMLLKNSERMAELTESVNVLQTQNKQLSSQLGVSKKNVTQVCQEKEQQQLRLVKEFEEKLKTAQRGSVGSKSIKRELQELLKEKHQEVNQLQQDCIKYQERFLDLEKALKASQAGCEQLKKELKNSSEKGSYLEDRSEDLEQELMTCKIFLQKANESVRRLQSEKEQLVLEMAEKSKKAVHQVTHENIPQNMYMEREAVLQRRIDELQRLKEKENQMLIELGQQMDSKDLENATLRREADTNMAKLAVMSSDPHGADASKQWNNIFQKALHEKDSQLLEQGFVIKQFLEDMRTKDGEINELRMLKSKLERGHNEYSVAAAAHQRQILVLGVSNTELNETVEIMNMHLTKLNAQVERLEQDKSKLNRDLADKEDVGSQRLLSIQQLEKISSDLEEQLYTFQSEKDTFKSDFEKQETISLQLKKLLQNKDAEISSLLSCRDGQMSGYLEQLQANHRAQIAGYEDRVTSLYSERDRADKETRRLENTVRSLQLKLDRLTQEKESVDEKMASFRNSMISLQTERERLISEYRMLEEKNQLALRDRDGSANGDLSATKGMKHEIRKLLHQMDDLNSENAMLRAQLVRYREDLNQVLSLKDNQLKELLKRQQDMIKNLEIQKAVEEKQHRDSILELQTEQETSKSLRAESSNLKSQFSNQEAELLALKMQRAETNEGKVISDLQQVVASKASECNGIQQRLSAQKLLTDELKNKLQQLESDTDKKLSEAEDKYNSELDTFEREVQLMRNERETADQRVQELARDLLQTEQLLSDSHSQSKDLTAKNESLGKAMAALQNDRDVLIEDFKTLQKRYDQELRDTRASLTKAEHGLQDATTELAVLAKENYVLIHKVNALSSNNTQSELNTLVDELSKALSEKEGELKRVSLENNTFSKQMSAFSKSMASLQNDRERLMGELVGAKRGQGAISGAVVSYGPDEPNGSRIETFQNERDGLEVRLKVLDLQKALEEEQACRRLTEQDLRSAQLQLAEMRSETSRLPSEALRQNQEANGGHPKQPLKEALELLGGSQQEVKQLQAERIHIHRELQRCLVEIQQRDQYSQQLNHKLGSVCAQVAPGAPQEKSSHSITMETSEASLLRERLLEVEHTLSEERNRREAAEESLSHAEERAKSLASSSPAPAAQRDFTVQLEAEDDWGALALSPGQPLLTRRVKGSVLACRRWLRGRSLYCSKLLTGRARSRHAFLAYLLLLHALLLMCLSGAL
uniref:Golgin subfamily B member 1-like n=1 Tax=Gadus morhua TaxID=8049 RepID=A0A8C5CKD0_GADMO